MKLEKVAQIGLGLFLLSPFDGDITITTALGIGLVADGFGVKL